MKLILVLFFVSLFSFQGIAGECTSPSGDTISDVNVFLQGRRVNFLLNGEVYKDIPSIDVKQGLLPGWWKPSYRLIGFVKMDSSLDTLGGYKMMAVRFSSPMIISEFIELNSGDDYKLNEGEVYTCE